MDAFPTEREAKRRVLLDAVERARPAVEAGIAAAESGSTLSMGAVEAMQDAGLFRLKMPAELGGADADPCTQMDVIEALTMVHPSIGGLGADDQRDRDWQRGGVSAGRGHRRGVWRRTCAAGSDGGRCWQPHRAGGWRLPADGTVAVL
jgi:alkylation response protein AidB-like acyl-CoA dehydrogenase